MNIPDLTLHIAFGAHKKDTHLSCDELTLAELVPLFTTHREGGKDGRYCVLAKFNAPYRKAENIATYTGAVVDIDRDTDEKEIRQKLRGIAYIAHSTYSPGRARVVVPYSQPVPFKLHQQISNKLNTLVGEVDTCSEKELQFFYLPACPKGAPRMAFHTLDADPLLHPLKFLDGAKEEASESRVSKAKGKSKRREGEYKDWLQDLLVGDDLHGSACSTIASMVARGLDAETIWAVFLAFEDQLTRARGADRVEALYRGELRRMIDGAFDKFAPVSFDDLVEAAAELSPESAPDVIEAIITQTTKLSVIERRQVFNAIKKHTGITLGDLRKAVAQEFQAEETPPIEYARKALAEYGPGNIAFASDAFWHYPGRGVWTEEHPEGVKQKIHAAMPDEELAGGVVESVLKLCRTECFQPGAQFGRPFEGVNVENGLLVHDGAQWMLEPHRRELYLLAKLPVEYDPAAQCPRFEQFLMEVFAGDQDGAEKIRLLLELIGYTLLPSARHEKFAMLIGSGGNGKSVLLEVLAELLGLENTAGVAPHELDNNFKRAYLHGKLANIVTEIAEGAVINDAALKAITSGELVTADHKHRQPFTFRPYSTCWFGTNHMPHTRDFSDALFRRACVITFNNKFEGAKKDVNLKSKLLNELPGILNLALGAIGDVLKGRSFAEPSSMLEARREWRLEADQILQFLEERCQRGRGEVQKGTLYRAYKDWAMDAGINRTLTQKSFGGRLKTAGIGERRDKYARWHTGIALLSPFSGGDDGW
ncbi:DNA primase family protein [Chromatocurvus halotolerans]|uniref:P4 family phage/plasmid primase-like protein n=1 Tax=Chromatocurvus halotolerans TaxID=1132028 RepID=A0A4R2KRZ2_9GAMM|nr:phage/plasmid primase, P4 family [Chromatocurvus halotolerans]TCO73766.1 P4 family phage/plasmid primase-like protein [Chromatocurvus halotolerans]